MFTFVFEMDHPTIQELIDNLTIAKKQHGNLPVVVGVSYSGNYWLEPIKKVTFTTTILANSANGDQETPVILLED